MNRTPKHPTWTLVRLISIGVLLCGQLSLLPRNAAAQEPTVEPTSLPTPTPAPTWTPAPSANTPTPTLPPGGTIPTPSGRVVDFRVDTDDIQEGDCVTFSWIVRGDDLDRVEFDTLDDGKVPVLVSDSDSREECPTVETKYRLVASWLDGSRTERSIKIEIDGGDGDDGDGDDGGSNTTPTPAGTAIFVPVTPIPIVVAPVSVPAQGSTPATTPSASGDAVMVPAGPLGSVSVLPETGYGAPPAKVSGQPESDLRAAPSTSRPVTLVAPLSMVILGLLIVVTIACDREA